jgi:pyruvate formate lyase activating enzyme
VKGLGLEIKLDTNGSNPEVVEDLIRMKLIDYVALDFKTRLVDYPKISKLRITNYELRIKKTLEILRKSGVEYELRTTVVPGIHNEKVIKIMAEEIREIAGEGVVWWLQNFWAGNCLDKSYNKKRGFSQKELEKLKVKAEGVIKGVKVRES